jgi:hypothetical protein
VPNRKAVIDRNIRFDYPPDAPRQPARTLNEEISDLRNIAQFLLVPTTHEAVQTDAI